jgi:preprotein translocase subunit YajC
MNSQALIQLMPLVLLIFIMYFLLIRPQKKREKTISQMRNSIKVGDEIITIGGICAKVLKIKEEKLTVEVGADKTKFEIMRWAVSKVVNENEEATKAFPPKSAKVKKSSAAKQEDTVAPDKAEEPTSTTTDDQEK